MTIVSLGLEMKGVLTRGDLESGIELASRIMEGKQLRRTDRLRRKDAPGAIGATDR